MSYSVFLLILGLLTISYRHQVWTSKKNYEKFMLSNKNLSNDSEVIIDYINQQSKRFEKYLFEYEVFTLVIIVIFFNL